VERSPRLLELPSIRPPGSIPTQTPGSSREPPPLRPRAISSAAAKGPTSTPISGPPPRARRDARNPRPRDLDPGECRARRHPTSKIVRYTRAPAGAGRRCPAMPGRARLPRGHTASPGGGARKSRLCWRGLGELRGERRAGPKASRSTVTRGDSTEEKYPRDQCTARVAEVLRGDCWPCRRGPVRARGRQAAASTRDVPGRTPPRRANTSATRRRPGGAAACCRDSLGTRRTGERAGTPIAPGSPRPRPRPST
jgi:hypothetical protein